MRVKVGTRQVLTIQVFFCFLRGVREFPNTAPVQVELDGIISFTMGVPRPCS